MSALDESPVRIDGELTIGGQEHFYLETQAAHRVARRERRRRRALVHAASVRDAGDRRARARLPRNQVTVECLRMGGAFGGKEVQANAVGGDRRARRVEDRRPVRVRLTRSSTWRSPASAIRILARYYGGLRHRRPHRRRCASRSIRTAAGASTCRSRSCGASLFHCDNAYLPAGRRGRPAASAAPTRPRRRRSAASADRRACSSSRRSWRSAARRLGLPRRCRARAQLLSRRRHDALRPGGRRRRPHRHASGTQLKDTSEFDGRRDGDRRASTPRTPHTKRGLAITPVKFGISFTATFYNQAGALVLVYRDGSVQVNHGGTEMGQGLHTKIQQIAADSLGVPLERVRVMPTRTDKVPNTSATAASAGTDLNGAAVADACAQIRAG